jgi:hypothetical protein
LPRKAFDASRWRAPGKHLVSLSGTGVAPVTSVVQIRTSE